jgi:hypothetical protein
LAFRIQPLERLSVPVLHLPLLLWHALKQLL